MKWTQSLRSNVIVLCIIASLFSSPCAHSGNMSQLRNQRYCEILLTKGNTDLKVYNTIGLNHCPADLWSQITEEKIKKETGAYFVHLNGPRY